MLPRKGPSHGEGALLGGLWGAAAWVPGPALLLRELALSILVTGGAQSCGCYMEQGSSMNCASIYLCVGMHQIMLMHELCFCTSVCMCVDGIPNTDTEGQQLLSSTHDMTILSYRLQKEMLQAIHAAAAISVSICILLLARCTLDMQSCTLLLLIFVMHLPLLTGCCIQPWQNKCSRHGAGSKLERAPRVTQRVPAR